jgi:hypothetical protein
MIPQLAFFILLFCSVVHLARLMILHLTQAFVAPLTSSLRPPPKPDPSYIARVLLAIVISADWSPLNLAFVFSAYLSVRILNRKFLLATAVRRLIRERPPFKPPPITLRETWIWCLLILLPPTWCILILGPGVSLDLQDQVIGLWIACGLLHTWMIDILDCL